MDNAVKMTLVLTLKSVQYPQSRVINNSENNSLKIEMKGWRVEATSGAWPSVTHDARLWLCYVRLTSRRIISHAV